MDYRRELPISVALARPLLAVMLSLAVLTAVPALAARIGLDYDGVFLATGLTLIIGFLAGGRLTGQLLLIGPVTALTGEAVYMTILAHGHTWAEVQLAAVLASLLLLFGATRRKLLPLLPKPLRHGLVMGLGAALLMQGLTAGEIIIPAVTTISAVGDPIAPTAWPTLVGIILTVFFWRRGKDLALLSGVGGALIVAILSGAVDWPETVWSIPGGLYFTAGHFALPTGGELLAVAITQIIAATVTALAVLDCYLEPAGEPCDAEPAVKAAAIAGLFGAVLGTGLVAVLPETALLDGKKSAAGKIPPEAFVAAAGVGGLLFFAPLAKTVAACPGVTAAAFIVGGAYIVGREISRINFSPDEFLSAGLPPVLTAVVAALAYSVTAGLAAGLAVYIAANLARRVEIPAGTYILAGLYLLALLLEGMS